MAIVCAICNETINYSGDINVTPCGHIFHFNCLAQWLPRSSTCPECRRKTTFQTIQKLYFNVRNDNSLIEDPSALHDTISEKDSQIHLLKQEKAELELSNIKNREKILNLEENLLKKEAAFNVVKRQCDHYRVQVSEIEDLKKKVKTYEDKSRLTNKISELLTLSANEVDSMMSSRDVNIHDLQIFVSALKRELRSSEDKRHSIRSAYQQSQHDLIKYKAKCEEFKKKMENFSDAEQKLAKAEMEKNSLMAQIQELQMRHKNDQSQKIKQEIPAVQNTGSPYLQIESSSVGMMPLRQLNDIDLNKRKIFENSKYSIFKKPRLGKVQSLASFNSANTSDENLDAKPSSSQKKRVASIKAPLL